MRPGPCQRLSVVVVGSLLSQCERTVFREVWGAKWLTKQRSSRTIPSVTVGIGKGRLTTKLARNMDTQTQNITPITPTDPALDPLQLLMREARNWPLLTPAEEIELAKR